MCVLQRVLIGSRTVSQAMFEPIFMNLNNPPGASNQKDLEP